jgi:hypothetical protein
MTTNSATAATHTAPEFADLAARDVLAVDGEGSFTAVPFTSAIAALFATRVALGASADLPLEGSYTQGGDHLRFDVHDDPDGWRWQLALPAPEGVAEDAVTAARVDARIRLARQAERRVARLVHHGPYADEQPSLDALYDFIAASGRTPAGPHTEVYLTDPATTPPAEMRTILQVPVR